MIKRLLTLAGIISFCFIMACSGGSSDSPPPMPPSSGGGGGSGSGGAGCNPQGTGGGSVAVQTQNGYFVANSNSIQAQGPNAAVNVQRPQQQQPAQCYPVDPQSLMDLQSAYNRARQICCSAYAQSAQAAVAACSNPSIQVPPPNTSSCDQALVQAVLLGKTVYGPWGGDAYSPYRSWATDQIKSIITCVASSAGISSPYDPRIACALKSQPAQQAIVACTQGAAGMVCTQVVPYAQPYMTGNSGYPTQNTVAGNPTYGYPNQVRY